MRCDVRRAVVLHDLGRLHEAARLNEQLWHGYAKFSDCDFEQAWSVARLASNLFQADLPREAVQAVDQWRDGLEDPSQVKRALLYALGTRAMALGEG